MIAEYMLYKRPIITILIVLYDLELKNPLSLIKTKMISYMRVLFPKLLMTINKQHLMNVINALCRHSL